MKKSKVKIKKSKMALHENKDIPNPGIFTFDF